MKFKPYNNEFCYEKEAKESFQILCFYNVLIEKPKFKHLSNMKLLHKLPFCDELSVLEKSKAFRRYARNYKVQIIDSKDHLAQSEARKSTTEDLFKNHLNEVTGFKYQITVTVFLFVMQTRRKWRVCSCLFQFCN